MNNELKPCPFCGGKAKTESLGDSRGAITAIYCDNAPKCGAMVTFIGNESKSKAIAAWNTRKGENNA